MLTDLGPDRQQYALTLVLASAVFMWLTEVASYNWPINGRNDLCKSDLLRWSGQCVATPDSAFGPD